MDLKNQQQTTSSPDHHLPFQYSLRPTTDHPPLNPDPAAPSPSSPVWYRQCLKNHAVKTGGHVLDGCGEFMPSGEEGTPDSFKCAACECHRSFHRRVLEEEDITNGRLNLLTYGPPPYNFHFNGNNNNQCTPWSRVAPAMMTFGGSAEAPAESSSDGAEASGKRKKRFRTKFSGEQKAKMMELANKLGWKIQKDDEQQVHQFCNEIGIKKLNFKVWMHNNKQPTNNNSSG
ncbi:zinc-finger homeodomain protein 10-like [Benincasa hispida]|uniref:zinc-finger homeodomain protein 10-like n=1 Tax=Benincasa hispida TaxID=102211 RepID=UPI001900BEAE|nr:zinc-finger homeodomain protein 10-like [Benincasa hispida]